MKFIKYSYLRRCKSVQKNLFCANSSANTAVWDRRVALWLFGCAASVGGIVAVGGWTRLTKSGLSMVDWRLTGTRYPRGKEQWMAEFDKYKAFPEYKKRGSQLSLEEFKSIYFWEWFHRMWGRGIGLVFLGPLAYFAARRKVTKPLRNRLLVLGGLGGCQGLVGWWMVKSGLKENNGTHLNLPRVSAYRLSVHLVSAFTIYLLLMYTALECWSKRPRALAYPSQHMDQLAAVPSALRRATIGTLGLTWLTAFSGAYVSGNEAGLVYNEWPKMGLGYFPSDYWNEYIEPSWRNVFEHNSAVQFNHRTLAYATFLAANLTFLYSARLSMLLPSTRILLGSMAAMSWIQASLGIVTLLNYCPIQLASLHQMGSLCLLTTAIVSAHACRRNGLGAIKAVQRIHSGTTSLPLRFIL